MSTPSVESNGNTRPYRHHRSTSIDSHASELDYSSSNQHEDVATPVPTAGVDDDDGEDVRIAIAALGIMRSGSISSNHSNPQSNKRSLIGTSTNSTRSAGPSTEATSSTGASSPNGGSSIRSASERGEDTGDPTFIARVSQLPLVSGGLEWYERSKANSRVVKYGAGLVESSLSSISRPLVNNVQLGQLDEFACRQLDRLGGPNNSSPVTVAELEEESRKYMRRDSPNGTTTLIGPPISSTTHQDPSSSSSPNVSVTEDSGMQQAVAVVSRSRWQTVLVEAGGIGAAVSDESLKSLRYCLQWLLYATAHLDHQITVLRDFIASLHRHQSLDSRSEALITVSASAHLIQIKHDVVETIRKVVDVVSKYAGAALPTPAKKYVRQSILSLPVKWASAIEGGRDGRDRARSASVSASHDNGNGDVTMDLGGANLTNGVGSMAGVANTVLRPTEEAAERVLTFAVESLDMLKSVTQIFGDSVEKAEAWIERLRIVGIDRIRERQAAAQQSQYSPPPDDYPTTSKRRRSVISPPVNGDGVLVVASGMERGGREDERGDEEDPGLTRRKRGGASRASEDIEL